MNVGYRPEIDGLRAIAVVAVIIFHAKADFLSGGFLGVDIFFLISGYLITGIIAREGAAGRFSIARFYERRARRILPALIAVLLACVPVAWLWMMPEELAEFGRSLVATNLFISNYFFRAEVDYFAEAAELKPLIHTWSLAVEEQFYIVFPLMLVALLKLRRSSMLMAIFGLAAASLLLAEYWSRVDRSSNFYLLFPRAWELLLGSLIALSAPSTGLDLTRRQLLAVTGLVMVLVPLFAFDETMPLPGWLGLIPSGGAALLIRYAGSDTVVGRWLGSPVPVAIGLISYSAYLWHQPVFVFARLRLYRGIDGAVWIALIALTFALAWATWRFVESPFRDKSAVSIRQLLAVTVPLTAVLLIVGAAWHVAQGLPGRVPDTALALERLARETRDANRLCQFGESRPFDASRACQRGPSQPDVVIWGDSHATALASGLMPALAERNIGSVLYASSSCVPMLGYEWASHRKGCRSDNLNAFDAIINDAKHRTVILLGRWTFFVEHSAFDNGEGGVEHNVSDYPVFDAATPDAGAALRLTIARLLAARKRVVLVYPVPEVGWNVTRLMSRRLLYRDDTNTSIATSWKRYATRNHAARMMLDSVEPAPGLIRVDPADLLCADRDKCIASDATGPLYFDDDHLSRYGATLVAGPIISAVRQLSASFDETRDR